MRILVIGATGTIGNAVATALEPRHEILRASRSAALRVDMGNPESIGALLESVGNIDAIVCCAASGSLTPITAGSDDVFMAGLREKLLGQVILVRRALEHLNDNGSITLTSGTFKRPTPGSSFGILVNSGLNAFAQAAAREMPSSIRLNVVSPGWVRETLEAMGMNGEEGTPARHVASAYVHAIEGEARGAVIRP